MTDSTVSPRASCYLSHRVTRSVNIVPGGDKKVRHNSPKANTDSPTWLAVVYMQRHTVQTRRTCRERQVSLTDGVAEVVRVSFCRAFDLCEGKVSGDVPDFIQQGLPCCIKSLTLECRHNRHILYVISWPTNSSPHLANTKSDNCWHTATLKPHI